MVHVCAQDKAVNQGEIDAQVEQLYHAGEGKWGTDEKTMIELICTSGPGWLKVTDSLSFSLGCC